MKVFILLGVFCALNIYAFDKKNLIEKHFKAKKLSHPLREVSIIVSEEGFYPKKIVAFKGEKLRFFITSTTKNNQCLVLQKHEVFLAAQKGQVNEGEVELMLPGRFRYYCPANKFEGYLTVIDKYADQKERSPASLEVAKDVSKTYWMPRDYD